MNISPLTANSAEAKSFTRHLNSQIREIELEKHSGGAQEHKKRKSLKTKVATTAAVGILGGLAVISKGKFNPINPKSWGNYKNIPFAEKIIHLGGASILGGLAGGIVFDDKKNIKPKLREGTSQMIGNIIAPVALVTAMHKFVGHIGLEEKMFQFKKGGQGIEYINKCLKKLPNVGLSIIALGAGIMGGNILANKLNALIFDKKEERKVRLSDFSGHIDDVCTLTTLVAPENKFCQAVGNFIPLALMVPGISTGMADGTDQHGHHKKH